MPRIRVKPGHFRYVCDACGRKADEWVAGWRDPPVPLFPYENSLIGKLACSDACEALLRKSQKGAK